MRDLMPFTWIAVALASACSGGDDDDGAVDPCAPEDPLEGTGLEDIAKIARFNIQERPTVDGPTQRLATASFVDFSTYDGDSPPTNQFDLVCTQVTGLEVVRSEATTLEAPSAATLTVGGAPTEFTEVVVKGAPSGRMTASGFAELAQGTTVGVDVEGGDGEDEFPSFTAELEAPDAPTDLSVESGPAGSIRIRWHASGGDAVEVELRATDGDPGDAPVRCVVADDGCVTVNSIAIAPMLPALDVEATTVRFTQWDGPDGEIGFVKIERRRDTTYEP